jgi:MFS family permease
LWVGASVSLVGDGMTFVALTWLVLGRPGGTGRLGLLAVLYTAPVLVGGLLVGPLLDRFDKRVVLVADSVVRGAAVASVPVAAALGGVPGWLPFAVAAVYGLLKMVPLAGFPAAIPDLVPPDRLDAANALESLSFGVAGIIGPALAGLLLTAVAPATVLALDAASYLVFALSAATIRQSLPPAAPDAPSAPDVRPPAGDDVPVVRRGGVGVVWRDRVLLVSTVAFMAFNVAEGMLLVVGPWLARTRLVGGARDLGLLLAALSAGELVGAAVAGAWHPRIGRLRAIAAVQVVAAAGFLGVLAVPGVPVMAAGYLVVGLFSAPMTVWAQSVRMRRVPAAARGRVFALLRTLMQATPPIGAALVTPLLQPGRLAPAALLMAALAGLPAVALLPVHRLTGPPSTPDPPTTPAAPSVTTGPSVETGATGPSAAAGLARAVESGEDGEDGREAVRR